MGRKIVTRMNRIRLKKKIALLFLVCVLVPMVTTNGYILFSLRQGIQKEQRQKMENIADHLEYEWMDHIHAQLSIADYLNHSEKLRDFLSQRYPDPAAYYDAYLESMEDDIIHYYYMALSAHAITICTGNQSITNGNYFVKKEDVEGSSWYQAFEDSGRTVCLYPYFEDGTGSSGYVKEGRHIVIMQKLDYCGEGNMIMLDLDYQMLIQNMDRLCEGYDFCICNGDKILFSSYGANDMGQEYVVVKEREDYGMPVTIRFRQAPHRIADIVREQIGPLAFLYAVNLLLPTLFVCVFYQSLDERVSITQEYMERVKNGIYETIPREGGTDEIGSMMESYNLMALQMKELIGVVYKNKEREQSLELSKKQAELSALQSQLNPHFVFNALESIRMHSILKEETETAKILENFAVLMRRSIQWDRDFVTVEEECGNIKRYLEIQKYRFGKRMEFFLCIQEECKSRMVPKFILITFVENACVHGIEKSVKGGSVTVVVSEDEELLYFEIMDKGIGMEQKKLEEIRDLLERADLGYIKKAKVSGRPAFPGNNAPAVLGGGRGGL